MWIHRHLDGSWRAPSSIAPKATLTYAQAGAPSTKGKKSRQAKPAATASSGAVASREAFVNRTPPLPQAVCMFFASRTTLAPHPEATNIAAHFPDIAASVLRDANSSLPLSFSSTVNDRDSVSLLGGDRHPSASAYTPYFAPLTTRLNKAFLVGNSLCVLVNHALKET